MDRKAAKSAIVAAHRAADILAYHTGEFWKDTRAALRSLERGRSIDGVEQAEMLGHVVEGVHALRDAATEAVQLSLHAANQEPAIVGDLVAVSYVNLTMDWRLQTLMVLPADWSNLTPEVVVAATDRLTIQVDKLGSVPCELLRNHLAKEALRAAGLADKKTSGGDDVPCLVTLRQMAAIVNNDKKTLERFNAKGGLPAPAVVGGRGIKNEWDWSAVRGPLSERFNRELPERFPADRFVDR